MNQENLKYLRLYETIKRNMGCTPKSIEAIIWTDLRLFAEFLGEKPFYLATMQDVEEFFTYCFNERHNGAEYEIQKILGHSSIASTQIYANMSLDQAQASVERFDNQNKWLE